jgi:uncharacterized protein YjbJ (UPF0337 family)
MGSGTWTREGSVGRPDRHDLDRTEGKRDRLVGLIKERTGETASEIERKLRDIFDKF